MSSDQKWHTRVKLVKVRFSDVFGSIPLIELKTNEDIIIYLVFIYVTVGTDKPLAHLNVVRRLNVGQVLQSGILDTSHLFDFVVTQVVTLITVKSCHICIR